MKLECDKYPCPVYVQIIFVGRREKIVNQYNSDFSNDDHEMVITRDVPKETRRVVIILWRHGPCEDVYDALVLPVRANGIVRKEER